MSSGWAVVLPRTPLSSREGSPTLSCRAASHCQSLQSLAGGGGGGGGGEGGDWL